MTVLPWLATADQHSPWQQLSAVVTGLGVSGAAVADVLAKLGSRVTVLDEQDGDAQRDRATTLEAHGAIVRLGPAAVQLPAGTQLVVTSPGWRPNAALFTQAAADGVPVWGEVELAWRLRNPATPWLTLTGTNGKTTTVRMLAAMLGAAGLRTTAAGNVGDPIISAVVDPAGYDVIAVELSSYQLHWTYSVAAQSAALLNVAPDHVDWHGTFDAYAADKARIYARVHDTCVYNAADRLTEQLLGNVDLEQGVRAVGFTLNEPDVGMLGVTDGVLTDRAFGDDTSSAQPSKSSMVELAAVDDVTPPAPHNVANALAAAALARSFGVPPYAVRDGLRGFQPDPHRIQHIATIRGVRYVDDSKATNPHAAAASLMAYDSVVWIAGGLAKGATFDELVTLAQARLRGVILIGADQGLIADTLSRHAPDIPVIRLRTTQNHAVDTTMSRVVEAAAGLAQSGDTVLLAPACASFDMFANYGARGDAFAAAVRRHELG